MDKKVNKLQGCDETIDTLAEVFEDLDKKDNCEESEEDGED